MKYVVKIPKQRIRLLRKDNEKLKKHFEKITSVTLEFGEEDEVWFETDDPIKAMNIKQVLIAFGRGFDLDDALNLLDDSYGLEIINITDYVGKSKSRLVTMRGRIIGTDGKTKRTIENAANVKLAIYGKTVSILGRWEDIPKARRAIEMLLEGKMHSTVYRWLETHGG
ncbi:MAG: RNA-processing protein [Candidatus Aenigmarchaeota archaeon]|nr:RNA-processing protein [Candidatus Aenigmarchaeota archaeon]